MTCIFGNWRRNTKFLLLKFDEKYPGVLGEKNVNSVIESVGQKGEDKLSLKATLEQMKQMKKE